MSKPPSIVDLISMLREAADALERLGTNATPSARRGPLMTIAEVMAEVGLSRTTLWHKWTTGQMPKPLTLGHRTVRFRRADIEAWIAGGCRSARVTAALRDSERRR